MEPITDGEALTEEGRIIRGIAGFYYVETAEGTVFECKAKGIFRKDGTKPLVGDICQIMRVEESDPDPEAYPVGNICRILPRKSELLRPAVANVDQALLVFALRSPQPNLNLLDTFLLRMELQKIPAIIAFNKTDLDPEGELAGKIRERFAHTDYPVFLFCAKKGEGIQALKETLMGKCTAVAGPSGVGKSSLINLLQSNIAMETSGISKKTERGKHTTRRSELIRIGDHSYIMDTPGFTSLGTQGLEAEQIAEGFREIVCWQEGCRFAACSHISEPDCLVKEKMAEGLIHPSRYESYVKMYRECKDRKRY
ncbi:MAG: ribosome small subunit-dependent GTPase A [Lachnospiraceae bacterium]|nr:ribosome small subunit-dependent GTPase A [Lachnospiraceae bacterium]